MAPCMSLLRSAFVFTSSRPRISGARRASGLCHTIAGTSPCAAVEKRRDARSPPGALRLSSSAFQAPEPPTSKGEAVYQDIDLELDLSDHSLRRNADPNAVFVVTGASRGIGLQLVKTLATRTKGAIVACCRSPDDSKSGLSEFLQSCNKETKDRINKVALDLTSQKSVEDAAAEIQNLSGGRVDMLLNVAGILGDGETTPGPERALRAVDRDWMELSLQTNCIGPIMFAKQISPFMTQRRGKNQGDRPPVAIIANWSARVGSISDNNLGGWYSYRLSKAALNQATRTMSHELKRQAVWTIALHPGTTDSDLSKPFQKNVAKERLFPVEFTVDQLLSVLDHMEESNSGELYDWAGKAIPF